MASYTKACSGLVCTFTSTSTGPITSTAWDFSDGQNLTGVSVQRNFSARTNYTFVLTVRDANGNTDTANGSVACNPRKCQ